MTVHMLSFSHVTFYYVHMKIKKNQPWKKKRIAFSRRERTQSKTKSF